MRSTARSSRLARQSAPDRVLHAGASRRGAPKLASDLGIALPTKRRTGVTGGSVGTNGIARATPPHLTQSGDPQGQRARRTARQERTDGHQHARLRFPRSRLPQTEGTSRPQSARPADSPRGSRPASTTSSAAVPRTATAPTIPSRRGRST
jgi:hypothetical protein